MPVPECAAPRVRRSMTSTPALRFFNTGEIAIHYAEWPARKTGSGSNSPAFLFIHGITGRHETWHEVAGGIRGGARVIAVDLRGHGRSGHSAGQNGGAYRLPDYARDMASLIDGLELGPVVVVGHSLGAMTALQLAATRPELAAAIVLEDPPLFARHIMANLFPERHRRFERNGRISGSGLSVAEMAAEIRSDSPEATEEAVLQSAQSLFVTDADAIAHVHDQRIDWSADIEPMMRSVQCPVLLMRGNVELGAWMRVEDGELARSLMTNCELSAWDDTGHLLHADRPERFARQVREFVARLEVAAAN